MSRPTLTYLLAYDAYLSERMREPPRLGIPTTFLMPGHGPPTWYLGITPYLRACQAQSDRHASHPPSYDPILINTRSSPWPAGER